MLFVEVHSRSCVDRVCALERSRVVRDRFAVGADLRSALGCLGRILQHARCVVGHACVMNDPAEIRIALEQRREDARMQFASAARWERILYGATSKLMSIGECRPYLDEDAALDRLIGRICDIAQERA